jgi:NTP pyrophosphatase (non-canonical NTP hydrolase)
MSNADELRAANPWQPMSNPVDLAHLGKLGEECGELVAAKERCTIQGIDEREPVTGKLNREWLEDEIADVKANIELVMLRFNLDRDRIARRAGKKMEHLRGWHVQLSDTHRPEGSDHG